MYARARLECRRSEPGRRDELCAAAGDEGRGVVVDELRDLQLQLVVVHGKEQTGGADL